MSQGEACASSLAAAPCPDPLWLCGGQLTVANSVYQAAKAGLCSGSGNTTAAACATLDDHPEIAEYAAAGECEPTCLAELTPPAKGGGDGNKTSLAPPPPPPPVAGGCWVFWLQVDAPNEAAARAVATNLHNATTAGALLDSLASYSAPAPGHIRFLIGDSGALHGLVAYLWLPAACTALR